MEELLPDCVALEARAANVEGLGRIAIRELVRCAIRMRPTRIIVGEVRGPEALDMLSAMNTGHEGSMGTIHANSARHALSKLRTYALMAEERRPNVAIIFLHMARRLVSCRGTNQTSELPCSGLSLHPSLFRPLSAGLDNSAQRSGPIPKGRDMILGLGPYPLGGSVSESLNSVTSSWTTRS